MEDIIIKANGAKNASKEIAKASTKDKNTCIANMIRALKEDKEYILSQNKEDVK